MKLITILLLAVLLCGCASVGKNFDSRKVAEIKKGETTEADLVRMFGQPANRAFNSESGSTLTWNYFKSQASGANFVPVVNLFAGSVDITTKTLIVSLAEGVVTNYSFTGTAEIDSDATKPLRSPKVQ